MDRSKYCECQNQQRVVDPALCLKQKRWSVVPLVATLTVAIMPVPDDGTHRCYSKISAWRRWVMPAVRTQQHTNAQLSANDSARASKWLVTAAQAVQTQQPPPLSSVDNATAIARTSSPA